MRTHCTCQNKTKQKPNKQTNKKERKKDLSNEKWLRKIGFLSLEGSDLTDTYVQTDKIDLDKLFLLAKTQNQDDIMHNLEN